MLGIAGSVVAWGKYVLLSGKVGAHTDSPDLELHGRQAPPSGCSILVACMTFGQRGISWFCRCFLLAPVCSAQIGHSYKTTLVHYKEYANRVFKACPKYSKYFVGLSWSYSTLNVPLSGLKEFFLLWFPIIWHACSPNWILDWWLSNHSVSSIYRVCERPTVRWNVESRIWYNRSELIYVPAFSIYKSSQAVCR